MFDLSDLLLISVPIVVAALFWRAQGSRELALQAAQRHCNEMGVQWLDGSVALKRIKVARNARGRLCLSRSYLFEFSSTGDERYQGWVTLLGSRIQSVQLQAHRLH